VRGETNVDPVDQETLRVERRASPPVVAKRLLPRPVGAKGVRKESVCEKNAVILSAGRREPTEVERLHASRRHRDPIQFFQNRRSKPGEVNIRWGFSTEKAINHKGHQGTQGNLEQGLPSCTFVPLVVNALTDKAPGRLERRRPPSSMILPQREVEV